MAFDMRYNIYQKGDLFAQTNDKKVAHRIAEDAARENKATCTVCDNETEEQTPYNPPNQK